MQKRIQSSGRLRHNFKQSSAEDPREFRAKALQLSDKNFREYLSPLRKSQ